MGILSALLANWRLGLYAAVALAIAFGGWHIKSRFSRAAEADRLETLNETMVKQAAEQQKKLAKADADRVKLAADLAAARAAGAEAAEVVTNTVRVYVKDSRACDIPPEVLRALNVQMGHEP